MDVDVIYSEDPAWVLDEAHAFLSLKPVLHNLILSLLRARIEQFEPGRYWVAKKGNDAAGVVFQSPVDFLATITPADFETVSALVEAIVTANVDLPGVSGMAATAAQFAGQWTERKKSAAVPAQGQRIYTAEQIQKPTGVSGRLRRATSDDRDLVIEWIGEFYDEIDHHADPTAAVDRRLPSGLYWLWEDGQPVSMAGFIKPVAGVVRIGAVFTPTANRQRGYAGACTAALSQQILDRGLRPILYTDLGNPVSNSIYRRIGFRAVAETLLYKFT